MLLSYCNKLTHQSLMPKLIMSDSILIRKYERPLISIAS